MSRINVFAPNLFLVVTSFVIFLAGCHKPSSLTVANPENEPDRSDKPEQALRSRRAESPSNELDLARSSLHENSLPAVPAGLPLIVTGLPTHLNLSVELKARPERLGLPAELSVALLFQGALAEQIVAVGGLSLDEAHIPSGRLRVIRSDAMESLFQSIAQPLQEPVSAAGESPRYVVPLLFQYPVENGLHEMRLRGNISILQSKQSRLELISNLQAFTRDDQQSAQSLPKGVRVHLLSPGFRGDINGIAVTFESGSLVSAVRVLNQNSEEIDSVWLHFEHLPEGRMRVLIASPDSSLPENLQLQYRHHTELVRSEIHFEFDQLRIPRTSPAEEPHRNTVPQIVRSGRQLPRELNASHAVEARAGWSHLAGLNSSGQETPRPLEIYVDIFGPKTIHCVAMGELKIESATAGMQPLILAEDGYGDFVAMQSTLRFYDPSLLVSNPPLDGAQALFQFVPPETGQIVERFQGSLKLLCATEKKIFVIDDLIPFLGGVVEHPVLKEHQVQLKPARLGEGINVAVHEAQPFSITDVRALDASGGDSRTIYSGRQQFRGGTVFSFYAETELPKRLPVRVTLNTKLEEVFIPFDFRGVPIPSFK